MSRGAALLRTLKVGWKGIAGRRLSYGAFHRPLRMSGQQGREIEATPACRQPSRSSERVRPPPWGSVRSLPTLALPFAVVLDLGPCLLLHVGADGDAGQDAQPFEDLLPLPGGVGRQQSVQRVVGGVLAGRLRSPLCLRCLSWVTVASAFLSGPLASRFGCGVWPPVRTGR